VGLSTSKNAEFRIFINKITAGAVMIAAGAVEFGADARKQAPNFSFLLVCKIPNS
jgi:hypothetical protein